jgi:hypothetical protein
MTKLAAFTTDVRALAARAKDMPRVSKELLASDEPAKARGRALGDIMISLLLPAVPKVSDAADRARQTFDNVTIAFALARYKLDHGCYPDALDALTQKYLKAVPGDVFSGKELIYRPDATGFLLYSVGPNGADDGGRAADGQPPGDDVVVRVPPRP